MKAEYKEQSMEFLEQRSFAVIGYSSDIKQPANAIYNRLKDEGYTVFAVNPKAQLVEDLRCYPNLRFIDHQVDVAILCTPKHMTEKAVVECSRRGIRRIWIHQGIVPGSYSVEAHRTAIRLGVEIISGGCPLMFLKPDIVHKCFRWFMSMPELD